MKDFGQLGNVGRPVHAHAAEAFKAEEDVVAEENVSEILWKCDFVLLKTVKVRSSRH